MFDKNDPLGICDKLDMALDDVILGSNRSGGYGKASKKHADHRSSPYGKANRGIEDKGTRGVGCSRVFVGNLSYSVTWQDLKDHMRMAGDVVHCDIIPQPGTALGSKGCGIVEFSSADEAARAIATLRDTELKGRPIFLREDREEKRPVSSGMPSRADHGSRYGRGHSQDTDFRRDGGASSRHSGGVGREGCCVFVGNLPYSATWKDLKDHMRQCGKVLHCDIIPEHGTALGSKGCGIVEFSTPGEAATAIDTLRDTKIKGRPIFLREDREMGKRMGSSRDLLSTASPRGGSRGPKNFLDRDTGMDSSRGGNSGGRRVFVANLAYSVTPRDLKDFMRAAGNVVLCDILPAPGTALGSKGCGVVEYSKRSEAERAIWELHDTKLKNRPVFVREDRQDMD
eukprot:TRINITY_DN74264_c0_g1_i1.p1 TRINITY_DN74264_c0_g1~~TRINITY_DN74264_c0_g1_i1.p1  ORF type:complete len:398 (-),score=34.06 TRINITY_DN74264_c0_g1_i1:107-1300(-)